MAITIGKPSTGTVVMGKAPSGNVQMGRAPSGNVSMGQATRYENLGPNPNIPGSVATFQPVNVNGVSTNTPGGNLLQGGSVAPGGGVGGGTAYKPLNTAAISNTQRTIDEIPGILKAALEAEERRYANTIGGFDAQEEMQRGTYNKSSETNQLNYDSTFMDAIRAGAKGFSNLLNILRGTGAVGGTAQDQVRDIVGDVTAQDIRGGADTRRDNQTSLDSALSTFLTELKGRRAETEDTFRNNQQAIRRDSNSQLQDLYSKMADYYSDAGQTDQANQWMSRAGNLTAEIARNSRPVVSNYNAKPIQVQAPELTAFAEPTQPEVAVAPETGQLGAGIFTMNRRREDERQMVGA